MKINKYPDGTSYIKELNPTGYTTFKINSYENLWHLNQYVDAYNNFNKGEMRPTITIPNLIDAQADKRFNTGESSGLKLVCEFLNNMNADFKIFHPHNPEVVEALIDDVEIIDNSEFIKRVLVQINSDNGNQLVQEDSFPDLILMSADAGGFKPLMKLCNQINWQGETYSASKARWWDKTKQKTVISQLVDRQDFGGKDILIVDDISVRGGTFKGLSKLLRECNCGKLYLAVSHITVQNLGEAPVTNYFDKVFTTNSKFDNYYFTNKEGYTTENTSVNLEVIKLF